MNDILRAKAEKMQLRILKRIANNLKTYYEVIGLNLSSDSGEQLVGDLNLLDILEDYLKGDKAKW